MVLLLLVIFTGFCDAYKILILNPKFAYSHMNFMGKIADTLVEAGHEVVTFQPVIEPLHVGNGTLKSRLIQRGPFEDGREFVELLRDEAHMAPIWTVSATNPIATIAFVPLLSKMAEITLSNVLDDKQLLDELRAEKFDVAITELFDFIGMGEKDEARFNKLRSQFNKLVRNMFGTVSQISTGVLEAIGLKNIVGAHSNSIMEGTSLAIGLPVIPSFVPASLGVTNDSTDLWTRATNLLFTYLSWYFQSSIAQTAEAVMLKKIGPTVTPIWETVSNMSWIVVNSEPLMEFDMPTLHKVVEVGGLGVHKPKPLDAEWSQVLRLRSRTVLISFGSVAKSSLMPLPAKKAILDVIKSFPDTTFIWKYEEIDDPMFKGVENLVLSKWTPQGDLLADDRLTLFITHGGAGSMMESATRGKPLIVVPLFGDQTRNAKLIEKFGFGVMVHKSNLIYSDVIRDAIDQVLNDPKYRTAALRMSRLLSRRQFGPEEKLVKTIELAAEFGDMPQSKTAGRKLGLVVYHNLDLFLILATSFVAFLSLTAYVVLRILKRCFSASKIKAQ